MASTNTNTFLVSVADVVIRDTVADQVVLKGKTLINSALKQSVNNQEIRGGYGDGLLYTYSLQKKIDITVEDARFDLGYIAMNNGVSIVNAAKNFLTTDESVTLSSDSGTLSDTPIGNIYVQKADNSIVTVTPTGKNFTVSGGGNSVVKVTYFASASVDSVSIDADKFAGAYELTMTARIFETTGQSGVLQIVVPQFKPNGTFDLTFTSSGVSTSKLEGMALVNPSDGAYAYVYVKPIGGASVSYEAIAAIPASVTLTTGQTEQLAVYGIRGGIYANVLITNDASTTYASDTTSVATVSATGLITYVGAGSAKITVTNGTLTDIVDVTCS